MIIDMKTSVKIYAYFVLLVAAILMSWIGHGNIRILSGILTLLLAAYGCLRAGLFWRELERVEELPIESSETKEYFQSSSNPVLHLMGQTLLDYARDLESRYSAKVEDRQSKINSLQSQINPHFLYNTLECIRSEAVCQGCGSIAKMAKALASFFRYSISRNENVVTVQDELNNIQHYIMIQNYRFEDKFQFRVEVEPEDKLAYACQIPKMTLQPIVENAIFHGLETKQGECHVIIRIHLTEHLILIVVSDNGIGMNEEQLKKLREGTEREREKGGDMADHGNGIALYNVNQRLKLLFGENYGLHIYSMEGEGTDVEIQMPVRTRRKD